MQVSQSRPQNNPSYEKPQKQTPIKSYPAIPSQQSGNSYPVSIVSTNDEMIQYKRLIINIDKL